MPDGGMTAFPPMSGGRNPASSEPDVHRVMVNVLTAWSPMAVAARLLPEIVTNEEFTPPVMAEPNRPVTLAHNDGERRITENLLLVVWEAAECAILRTLTGKT